MLTYVKANWKSAKKYYDLPVPSFLLVMLEFSYYTKICGCSFSGTCVFALSLFACLEVLNDDETEHD